jgi:Hemerythrin HHE cation binding domain
MTATRENDVVELLVDQHNEIRKLFGQLETAKGDRRRDLFEDLVRLLAVHETAEEEVVHPVARRKINMGDQVIDKRLAEEEQAKHKLGELHDLGIDHPAFDEKLVKLREDVLNHADREEMEEFSDLRRTLDPDQLRRMAQAVSAAEKTAPTRPHPKTGVSPAANILAGPPMAVFDRVRDAVRDWRRSHET